MIYDELGEIVVIARDRKGIEVGNRGHQLRRDHGLAVAATDDAVEFANGVPSENSPREFGKILVAFTGAHVIDPAELAVKFDAHLCFTIGTAKYDHDAGVGFLDAASQRERRNVLLKRRCESHDAISGEVD